MDKVQEIIDRIFRDEKAAHAAEVELMATVHDVTEAAKKREMREQQQRAILATSTKILTNLGFELTQALFRSGPMSPLAKAGTDPQLASVVEKLIEVEKQIDEILNERKRATWPA